MSIAQLSPNSVAANPAHVNPQVRVDQATTIPQVNQDTQKSVKATKTDTITFSSQAVKKLGNGVHSAVQDIKDGANKTASRVRGKA